MNTETWETPLFFELDKVETIAEEEAAITLDYTPPVILPDDTALEYEPDDIKVEPLSFISPASPTTTSPWLWLVSTLGLLLVLMLLVDTYHFIAQQYANSFFLGTLFLALIFTISTTTFILSRQAYQKIQTLRTVSALQKEGDELMEKDGYGHALRYINKMVNFYAHRPDVKERIERFYITLSDSHHDREVCNLFSNIVLKEIDQQAYHIVSQRSKETALMVMISQIALLDTVLTLWRNVRMIQNVATLYGGKPGLLGTMSLISGLVQNLIYADVSEMVADGVGEILGGSMLSVMSAQVAQGLGSGVLTARLGLRTMQTCRPLPFLETEKPRLKGIRREIIFSLKGIFEKAKV